MDNTELEVEKIRQKINKIKKNRKKKQNQALVYNYQNIAVIPTIYDIISSEKISDISNTIVTPLPPPKLQNLSYDYVPFNSVVNETIIEEDGEQEDKKKKEEEENWIIKTYQYWFPKQEGLSSKPNSNTPPSNDIDLMNLKFWSLPCNFLSSKFYTNIFAVLIEKTGKYEDTTIDQKNKTNDISLMQSFFDQMILIIIAYIMTINIYYFIFMYKWDCRHTAYVPKYGVYFGEYLNEFLDFFLKDTRGPVFYCQYIYTSLYPMIFNLLEVRKYKRLCFVFIFLFMLCFVFITGAQIGLSAHSFIVDGKINPLVTLIVLMSVFYGIFFADETKTDADLRAGLKSSCSDSKAISTTLREFCNTENIEKVSGRPYYYSLREKIEDFKNQINKLNKDNANPAPAYKNKLEDFVKKYNSQSYSLSITNTTSPIPSPSPEKSLIPELPQVPGLDPKQIKFLATVAVAKGYTIIRAIIRLIIAMVCLPVAQIFVSWFFLYTTSGIGLLFEEGFGIFQTILCIKGHMNDNNGEDPDPDIGTNQFYKSVNENSFFKFWVNELLLTTMYSIYCSVKFLTVPTQITKVNAQVIMAIIIAIICGIIIGRGYLLHRRYCNMNREACLLRDYKITKNKKGEELGDTFLNKLSKNSVDREEKRYSNLANRTEKEESKVDAEFKDLYEKYANSNIDLNKLLNYVIVVLDKNNNRKLLFDLNNKYSEFTKPIIVGGSIMPVAIPVVEAEVMHVEVEATQTKVKNFIFDNLEFELVSGDTIYIYTEAGKPGRIGTIKIDITKIDFTNKSVIEFDKDFVEDGMITKDNINALLFIYYTEFKPIITNLRRKHNVQNSIGKTLNKFNPLNLIHNKKSE